MRHTLRGRTVSTTGRAVESVSTVTPCPICDRRVAPAEPPLCPFGGREESGAVCALARSQLGDALSSSLRLPRGGGWGNRPWHDACHLGPWPPARVQDLRRACPGQKPRPMTWGLLLVSCAWPTPRVCSPTLRLQQASDKRSEIPPPEAPRPCGVGSFEGMRGDSTARESISLDIASKPSLQSQPRMNLVARALPTHAHSRALAPKSVKPFGYTTLPAAATSVPSSRCPRGPP